MSIFQSVIIQLRTRQHLIFSVLQRLQSVPLKKSFHFHLRSDVLHEHFSVSYHPPTDEATSHIQCLTRIATVLLIELLYLIRISLLKTLQNITMLNQICRVQCWIAKCISSTQMQNMNLLQKNFKFIEIKVEKMQKVVFKICFSSIFLTDCNVQCWIQNVIRIGMGTMQDINNGASDGSSEQSHTFLFFSCETVPKSQKMIKIKIQTRRHIYCQHCHTAHFSALCHHLTITI